MTRKKLYSWFADVSRSGSMTRRSRCHPNRRSLCRKCSVRRKCDTTRELDGYASTRRCEIRLTHLRDKKKRSGSGQSDPAPLPRPPRDNLFSLFETPRFVHTWRQRLDSLVRQSASFISPGGLTRGHEGVPIQRARRRFQTMRAPGGPKEGPGGPLLDWRSNKDKN